MRCGARSAGDAYMPPRETLATASSRPNSEALATRVVLAHPHMIFHPYTCGLCRGVVVIAVVLISYNDVEEMIMSNYFLYTDVHLR
jgi:hypothetical protein